MSESLNWRIVRAAIHEVDLQNRGCDSFMDDSEVLELVLNVLSSLAPDEEKVRRVALRAVQSENNYKEVGHGKD